VGFRASKKKNIPLRKIYYKFWWLFKLVEREEIIGKSEGVGRVSVDSFTCGYED